MLSRKLTPYKVIVYIILTIEAITCIAPLILMVMASFTDSQTLIREGYRFTPSKLSLEAYQYLWKSRALIFRAYGMSFLVTGIGAFVSLILTTMLGYILSKPYLPGVKAITFFVFFTMLFNGGLVPTYLLYTNLLHIKNTVWALIVPYLLVRAWYVMLVRSYFQNNVPTEVLEAAKIDGASEFQTFREVALPMAKPIVATVALFSIILYWNDWQNGLYFITKRTDLYTIQNLLNRMIQEIQYLSSNAVVGQTTDLSSIPSATARMAIAVIGILPIVILYPFIQKNFAKGITLGAVKG